MKTINVGVSKIIFDVLGEYPCQVWYGYVGDSPMEMEKEVLDRYREKDGGALWPLPNFSEVCREVLPRFFQSKQLEWDMNTSTALYFAINRAEELLAIYMNRSYSEAEAMELIGEKIASLFESNR